MYYKLLLKNIYLHKARKLLNYNKRFQGTIELKKIEYLIISRLTTI